jgi:hypothetical protein
VRHAEVGAAMQRLHTEFLGAAPAAAAAAATNAQEAG